MSKDTLHEGRRWIGQQLKLKKRRGTKLTYGGGGRRGRASERAGAQTHAAPDELQQLVFGRSGGNANDEVVQIVKNETLIALIRRNAGVVLDACMPAGRPRATTSNFIIPCASRLSEERRFVTLKITQRGRGGGSRVRGERG